MAKTQLEILIGVWDRQKSRPHPVGILEVVAARLFYVGIVLRQRPSQTKARVGIAADRAFRFFGDNKVRAKAAYERFALEMRGLGGTSKSVEGKRLEKEVEWDTLQADVEFAGIKYQDVNRRSRAVAREARETEQQQKAEQVAERKRKNRRKKKTEADLIVPALVTLPAPRLVRRR